MQLPTARGGSAASQLHCADSYDQMNEAMEVRCAAAAAVFAAAAAAVIAAAAAAAAAAALAAACRFTPNGLLVPALLLTPM